MEIRGDCLHAMEPPLAQDGIVGQFILYYVTTNHTDDMTDLDKPLYLPKRSLHIVFEFD